MSSQPTTQQTWAQADGDVRPQHPLRVALLTNSSSHLALPVLEALLQAKGLSLAHVFFYDTVAAARASFVRVVREHGILGTLTKAFATVRRRIRSWTVCRSIWGIRPPETCLEYAKTNAIQFSVFPDMNDEAAIQVAEKLCLDVLLICSCSQILKRPMLAVAELGAVNVHPSLLPRHRGPMPIFWALYQGDSETGVTFHVVTEKVDAGDVLVQVRVPIATNLTENALSEVLFRKAGDIVEDVLLGLAAGQIKPTKQSVENASYEGFPTPKQRREIRRKRR